MTVIGIDFGNVYTKVYKINNGRPEVVFNKESNRKIKSNIVFGQMKRYFDYDAYSKLSKNYYSGVYHLRGWICNNIAALSPYNYLLDKDSKLCEYLPNISKIHILSIFLKYIANLINAGNLECVISLSCKTTTKD